MPVTTQIPKGTAKNFQTLKNAQSNDHLALLRAYDKKEGKEVTLICAMNLVEDEYDFIPLAIMIEENPFERFEPPE